jgi:hypothetical protein
LSSPRPFAVVFGLSNVSRESNEGLTLVIVALLSLLYSQGEGHKGEVKKRYNVGLLVRPVIRRCLPKCIEAE